MAPGPAFGPAAAPLEALKAKAILEAACQAKEPREERQEMDRGAIEANAALLDKLMRLEAEQEDFPKPCFGLGFLQERRKQLASLLENQAARRGSGCSHLLAQAKHARRVATARPHAGELVAATGVEVRSDGAQRAVGAIAL